MPSTVHKRLCGVASAAVLGLLAAAPAHAASAPTVKSAYTVDADRDGHVDGVSLRWSKKVRGAPDSRAPFAFEVAGHRVTQALAPSGQSQRLRVAENPECDAGGSIRLAYRRPASGSTRIHAARGGAFARSHRLDMRRFDSPIPRITCAVTLDSDGDARVDGVRITYSRAVRNRAQRSGRFLFSVPGYRVTAVDAARGRFLAVRVAERATTDSGAKPPIAYNGPRRRSDRPYAVRAGRNAFTGVFQGTRDGVSPSLVSAATADSDRDGLLDGMNVRFSEPVRVAGAGGIAVLGMKVRSIRAQGVSAGLSLFEGTARGDARPGVWVAGAGTSDLSGNPAVRNPVSPLDRAAPLLTAALTQDTGGVAGRIDAVTVAFSEPVAHARDAGGAYPFLLGSRRVTAVEAATGRYVQVRIAEAAAADSGDRPSVRYVPGAGVPVRDTAGNPVADGLVNPVDGVAPVLLSAVTGDGDGDGRLDRATLSFSEDVRHASEAGGSSFSVAGHTVTGAGAAGGSDIDAALAEAGAPDSGARPAVAYTRDGVEDVRDDAGNATATSTIAQAADGARPVLLDAWTADSDSDGRLDRIDTTWSEPLDHGDAAAGPFRLSAAGFTVSRVRAADGASLAVDLTEPAAHDTGSTPAVSYGGGGDAVRDAAGLEPALTGWPRTTRDELAPRLVSASTGDGDDDGSIDSIALRFSETVLHEREVSPSGSFTAGALTILSAEAAAGDSVELKLQESGSGDTGLRPPVTYTPDAQEDIRDAAGKLAPSVSVAQASDGARPVLMSAATVDVDDDGRLDRVSTGWSEPVEHADDSSSPFPLSVEQLAVTRVRAAAGAALDIDLAEPPSADTGSAPDVTYTAGAADPVRDASGLEPAGKAHLGLTRDALPPRLVSTGTSDADLDGKLDSVEIEWSEQVTGSTATTPFLVAGRTLGANASFTGAKTRIPFTEDPAQFDTHETPLVSYDAAPGDLADIPEGVGDSSADAPAVGPEAPLDKAAPILVAAKTADLTTPVAVNAPNGTIDAVLVTFSEPIAHDVDGLAPFSLNVAGRTEFDVEGEAGATDRTLYVRIGESGAPDGGETPNVSVQAAGPAADHITDRAPAPNEARVMTFTDTADEVSPVLVSSQLGERGTSGACTKTAEAGIDGKVDCVLTTWSEEVEHAADALAPYSLSSSGWAIDAGGIGALPPSKTLEVLLTPSATPDRDRTSTTISYDGSHDTPVVDDAAAANEALDGTRSADAACRDTGREPNDSRIPDPSLELISGSPAFERKCAFDEDWFVVTPGAGGYLDIATRPVGGVDLELEVYAEPGGPVTADTVDTGGAGEVDRLTFDGLSATPVYWAHVSAIDAVAPQEGPYCVVYSGDQTKQASCGPLAGQIVFTEVGFGADKFVEIKNDFEVPVEMDGANAELVVGSTSTRSCELVKPTTAGESIIEPDEHVVIMDQAGPDWFGCDPGVDGANNPLPPVIASLDPGSEQLSLMANGAIDLVPFNGIFNSPIAAEHSLQFVESTLDQDHVANDFVATRWCRTFAAHSKGAAGDGCDEYRLNEVLWRPAGGVDGAAFVEVAGNIPARANSDLLAGWVLRGVNGLTGDGSADFVLPAGASPRANGTYVVADGTSGGQTVVADFDVVWNALNLQSTAWPDGAITPGPRGLQLLHPAPPSSPPCSLDSDAFGWTTTAQGFSIRFDDLRSCPSIEGQEYTTSTTGVSAARDNLSNSADTTYTVGNDTGNNRVDFCPQPPNPGQLNVGRVC